MSVKIREEIAQIIGTSVDNIEESYDRYSALLRIGKEGVIARKFTVFYKAMHETEDEAYARLVRNKIDYTPDITQVSTRDLTAELSRREGVRVINGEIVADDNGPATVIINGD